MEKKELHEKKQEIRQLSKKITVNLEFLPEEVVEQIHTQLTQVWQEVKEKTL